MSAICQHGGAGERAGAQIGERALGFGQGIHGDGRVHGDLLGERQELVPVVASQVRNRADRALVPQVLIRKARDVGHVDPGADDRATGRQRLQCRRDELARGREDDRRIELLGRRLIRRSRVRGAELARELLSPGVARAGERIHLTALVDGDLADLVRGRAEPVQTEPRAVPGEPQGPVADQPAAQQRRRLDVRDRLGDLQAEALVGDGQLGKAAVDVAAGEAGRDAQVLTAAAGSSGRCRRSIPATGLRRAARHRSGRRSDDRESPAASERRSRRRAGAGRCGTPHTR